MQSRTINPTYHAPRWATQPARIRTPAPASSQVEADELATPAPAARQPRSAPIPAPAPAPAPLASAAAAFPAHAPLSPAASSDNEHTNEYIVDGRVYYTRGPTYRVDSSPSSTALLGQYLSDTDSAPAQDLASFDVAADDPFRFGADFEQPAAGSPNTAQPPSPTSLAPDSPASRKNEKRQNKTKKRKRTADIMDPSYDEMEAKRQQMTQSFHDLANAMTRCVALIEDYARLAPSALTTRAALSSLDDPTAAFHALVPGALGVDAGKKPRQKREKKPKDPNAPKRPPSAYILYQNEVRESTRAAHPDKPYKEILGVIATQWKALSEPERKRFEKAYQDANVAWRTEEDAYKPGQAGPSAVAALAASSSDESSDEESEDYPSNALNHTPSAIPNLAAVVPPSTGKKEKKRKNLVAGAPVAVETPDKKKKKHKE